jgi:hypothetical protein
MINLDAFFKRYSNGDRSLGSRLATLKLAISLLNPDKRNNIVETGTTRKTIESHPRVEDRAADGGATVLFAHYASQTNGRVWTCDIEKDNIENCKRATKEYSQYVNYAVDDSVAFLQKFDQTIDLLYLDSVDSHLSFAADHQLSEITEAYDKLTERSIVLLDDLGQKTTKSIPFLREKNWCQISINIPHPSNYNNIDQGLFIHESFLYTDHSKIPEEMRFIER